MCGLLAGSGKIESRILLALGCLNESRGDDSAGVGWVERGEVCIEKVAQSPLIAFPLTLSKALKRAQLGEVCAIGHTRAATTGDVTSNNAHPFLVDQIAFAHNGIIFNHAELGKYEVDSQCLIDGIKERNFSKYEGSIALVWIQGGKLHAYRKGNPLFRGLLRNAVYLASERKFLEGVGCRKVRELSEGRVYCFKGTVIDSVLPVPTNKSYKTFTHTYSHTSWVNDEPQLLTGGKEPECSPKQESCMTPAVGRTLLRPTKAEALRVLNTRIGLGESYAEFIERRERRKNRLKLGGKIYNEEGQAVMVQNAEGDWLDMAPEDLCQNCMSEPALSQVDYGENCAVQFGLIEEKGHS